MNLLSVSDVVTLAQAKAHLRVTHDEDDEYISSIVGAASRHVVEATRSPVVRSVWEWRGDGLRGRLSMPVTSLSMTVDGDVTPVEYWFDGTETAISTTVPEGRKVRLEWEAGPSDPAPSVKAAVLLHVGSLYEHRETMVVGQAVSHTRAYEALVAPYRRW